MTHAYLQSALQIFFDNKYIGMGRAYSRGEFYQNKNILARFARMGFNASTV
jgi:hypothetical protein